MNIEVSSVTFNNQEWLEVREKVQLIETIIDGATQQKNINRQRLSVALSNVRSIQSKYFPQPNYSLYYFRSLTPEGKQPLNRQNYQKWKRLKHIKENTKIREFL